MSNDPFFNSPKSWSKRKHRLLGKYLSPFSAKVGSWAHTIYCVDGFAGAAKYEDGSPGSPLLMAQLADKCATWTKPVSLKLINVESDTTNFKSLCSVTQKWVDEGIVKNKKGEFGKLVPEIIDEISDFPSLFFIDPYGPTHVLFSHLLPILKRSQRATELIINFSAAGLRRIVDSMHSNTLTSSQLKATKTNIANVSGIIGSNDWEAKFAAGNLSLSQEREKVLLNEYSRNIAKYGYTVVTYAIRKSIDNSPKYYLLYCTRHRDGIVLMNSFIREEEDELLRESTTKPNQPLLPSDEFDVVQQEILQRRKELRRLLQQYLENAKKTTRGQIRNQFIFEDFGDFHDKDYNAVVKELIDTGKLQSGHGRKRINDNEPLTYTS